MSVEEEWDSPEEQGKTSSSKESQRFLQKSREKKYEDKSERYLGPICVRYPVCFAGSGYMLPVLVL